jgi:hypothetical protein
MGHGLLIHELSRSHTTTLHRRLDSPGRVIGSSQRPLPDKTHNRQTPILSGVFEPAIPAGERPQTYALDRAATGTGMCIYITIRSTLISPVHSHSHDQFPNTHCTDTALPAEDTLHSHGRSVRIYVCRLRSAVSRGPLPSPCCRSTTTTSVLSDYQQEF